MRRVTNWLLFLLARRSLALGVAERLGLLSLPQFPDCLSASPRPSSRRCSPSARCRSRFAGPRLPGDARAARRVDGGLAYFQFVIKPNMVKGFISAAFAPKPTAVSVEAARDRAVAAATDRDRDAACLSGHFHRAAGGRRRSPPFISNSGGDVQAGDLLINIDNSVEQADLANGLAQLKNADSTLARQKMLVGGRQHAAVDGRPGARRRGIRRRPRSQRTRAVIAQKAIRAPFSGRLGLRNADLGQYASVGMALATLQQLDPIYADFPVPEEALATLAAGQDVDHDRRRHSRPDVRGKDQGDRRPRQRRIAQRDGAGRIRQPGPQALARHVRQSDGHDRRASADVLTLPRTAIVYSLYGDNVFVVKPAPHIGRPARPAPERAGQGGRRRAEAAPERSHRRAPVRAASALSRGERIAIEEGVKAGERGRDRRADQAAGQFARRDRHGARAAAARRDIAARDDAPMNAFTDLFIRRPVLASVVSLLILLVGGMAGVQAADPPVPGDLEHHHHHHHHLSRRRGRRDQGLHHDADRTGGRQHRRHRHAGLDLAAERLDHHPQSATRRQSRPGDGRHALQGQSGAAASCRARPTIPSSSSRPDRASR